MHKYSEHIESYEGFVNYETWQIALLIDNDKLQLTKWRAIAGNCRARERQGGPEALIDLARKLREHFTGYPERYVYGRSFQAEVIMGLVVAALSRVNWFDLAEHILAGE